MANSQLLPGPRLHCRTTIDRINTSTSTNTAFIYLLLTRQDVFKTHGTYSLHADTKTANKHKLNKRKRNDESFHDVNLTD
jgi:hypothetical protein